MFARAVATIASNCEMYILSIDINVKSVDGATPLHMAVRFNNVEAATLLLQCGADTSLALLTNGMAPLHVSCRRGYLALVKVSLQTYMVLFLNVFICLT